MKFEILPFNKCGPLDWNMSPADVDRLIGAPEQSTKNRAGHRIEFRFNRTASFIFDKSNDKLVEVSCSGGSASLVFGTLDLNDGDPEDVVHALLSIGHQAVQGYGSIVFPALGIALTGYVPEDREIKAASAFASGRWDAMIKLMKPFRAHP